MASTYVNDLRLEEIGDGEQSGTWGSTTNTNLELIGDALGFGTEAITTNADTFTSTVADGAADAARAMYLKYTGTLDSACTITIAPNTLSRLQFIENATSGSQNIIISQGSGANVTIPPGDTKAVYLDGAGSGAAVVDAFASLNVVDLKVEDDLTLTSDSAVITFGADGDTTLTHTDGSGLTLNSTNKIMFNDASQFIQGSSATVLSLGATDEIDLTATAIDVNGTMDVSGAVTANAGVVIDNITIDGTEIDLSSGDLTIDVAGDITLDADGGDINFKDGGIAHGNFLLSGSDFTIGSSQNNGDLIFRGIDGGADITALTLDMSDAGKATFNAGADFSSGVSIITNDNNAQLTLISTDADDSGGPILDLFRNSSSPADGDVLGLIRFKGEDAGGNETTYAQIIGFIQDEAGGAEDGTFKIETLIGGSSQARLNMGSTSTVFNEGSLDLDFRVESNGDANMLFVDGGNDKVGIGCSPNEKFSVSSGNTTTAISIINGKTTTLGTETNFLSFFGTSNGGSVYSVPLAQIGAISANGSHQSGSLVFHTSPFNSASTERMRINNDGKLLYGMTSPLITSPNNPDVQIQNGGVALGIHSSNASNSQTSIVFQNDNGRVGFINIESNSISVNGTSDYRLKENVVTDWNATTRLKQLKPIRFNFITDADITLDGFLAHEVSSIVPEAISGSKDAMTEEVLYVDGDEIPDGKKIGDVKEASEIIPQAIDQSKLVPLLVKTIQELEARITTLENA